jgi:hypothetical protein
MELCRLLSQRKRPEVASYKHLSTAAVPTTAASRAVLSSSWWVRCGTSSSDQLESRTALEKQVGNLRIAQFWKTNTLYYIVCARFRFWIALLINIATLWNMIPWRWRKKAPPRRLWLYTSIYETISQSSIPASCPLYLRLVSKVTWLSALQAYANRVKGGSRPGRRWNDSNAGTFFDTLVQNP